jgi:ribosome-associated protein
MTVIEINSGVGVSEHELTFSFERSPGPGGQNVNKVNTRVTLQFDVSRSTSLSNLQKGRVRELLSGRIGQDGVLRIVSSKERTQLANRRAAVNRFIELLADAFQPVKSRVKTRPTAGSHRRRVEAKPSARLSSGRGRSCRQRNRGRKTESKRKDARIAKKR